MTPGGQLRFDWLDTQLAGKQCNPLFLTTSWQNDQYGEGTAVLMERDGIKNAFVLAPNYQAGKDVIAAFDRGFKGQKTGEILFKLGQTDFQPELSEIRAKRPESVMIFAPAAMGVARQQTRRDQHVGVRRVGAAGDRCDQHRPVTH